jgi:hypothetical protein
MDTPTETPTTEEQRAPDQDTAIEQAFAAGTLPGDDRRVEAAPEPNQEPAEITADPAADPAAPATPTPPTSVTISAENHQKRYDRVPGGRGSAHRYDHGP